MNLYDRHQIELHICEDAENYMDDFSTAGYVATGMYDVLLTRYSPGDTYDWDRIVAIDNVWISDDGDVRFEYTEIGGRHASTNMEISVLNEVAYKWLGVVAESEGVEIEDRVAGPIRSEEEIRREILDYNATCIDGFNSVPRVARGVRVSVARGNSTQYSWDHIRDITVWYEGGRFGFRLICDQDGPASTGEDCVVAGAVFNDLGQAVLDKAMKDFLGIDPNNPDEADFVPISNARR